MPKAYMYTSGSAFFNSTEAERITGVWCFEHENPLRRVESRLVIGLSLKQDHGLFRGKKALTNRTNALEEVANEAAELFTSFYQACKEGGPTLAYVHSALMERFGNRELQLGALYLCNEEIYPLVQGYVALEVRSDGSLYDFEGHTWQHARNSSTYMLLKDHTIEIVRDKLPNIVAQSRDVQTMANVVIRLTRKKRGSIREHSACVIKV